VCPKVLWALLRRTSSFGGGPIVVLEPALKGNQSGLTVTESKDPSSLRWLILLLSCLLLFGNYYAYDAPAALNRPLQAFLGHDYDTWQYELNLLYAVYSFPNMFLPLLGGSLLDSADPATVLLGFSSIVCLGQALFALGVTLKSFSLMLLGRSLFGIGGESISVAQATRSRNKSPLAARL
jgi:MFS family permease